MTKVETLRHKFVEEIPGELAAGTLYITLTYDTMAHLCACGCGEEIVTPIGPTDWSFSYNGAAVSVHPSIGNWSHACRSHYIIRTGRIVWSNEWTDEQIEAGRMRDRLAKEAHFQAAPTKTATAKSSSSHSSKTGWMGRLKRLVGFRDR